MGRRVERDRWRWEGKVERGSEGGVR